jgi:type IV pilus assembly protein PilN
MIRINLLGQESVKDNSAALQISTFVGTLALVLIVSVLLLRSVNNEIESTKQQVQQKELELTSLKKVTEEVRELEKKKAELKDKLLVIASLKSRKVGPVRVLDDLNLAMPEKSWLTEIKEVNGNLNIQGLALDNQNRCHIHEGLRGL